MLELARTMFEMFGTPVAYNMLENALYRPMLIWLLVVNFAIAAFFYLLLARDRALFNQMRHWWSALFSSAGLTTLLAFSLANQTNVAGGLSYGFFDFIEFLVAVFFWSLVTFFLFSLLLKRFNPSRNHLPIRAF